MKYYLAPLEGITTYVYRNAYHKYFRPMDKYFTPFIVPAIDKKFNTREMKELSKEHNEGLYVVPQLLTNNAEDFLKTAKDIAAFGYDELNLNLGCPSGTVVSKKKGSGFLAYPEELERFLDEIYSKADYKISIKTRIGKDDPEEFERLMEIYNKFPLEELIVHPRVQKDLYKNTPNWDAYRLAYDTAKTELCYNGDICACSDRDRLLKEFPNTECIMIGRGIIRNPALIGELEDQGAPDLKNVLGFHDMIYDEYQRISSGERNVLFKMKEFWSYIGLNFEGSEKLMKKIKKSERLKDYEAYVKAIFETCEWKRG